MKFIHRANVHGRIKTALFAGFVFWTGMTSTMSAYFSFTKPALEPRHFLIVSGLSLVAAILFGAAMSLRRPAIFPPSPEFDDGEDGLGVVARLIPPSPVLGARAFPESNEPNA